MQVVRLLADSSGILKLKNPELLDVTTIRTFFYLAVHSPVLYSSPCATSDLMSSCFTSLFSQQPLFSFICSLHPQPVFILATLIPLNTYWPEKRSKQIILLILFKAGRNNKLICSGG